MDDEYMGSGKQDNLPDGLDFGNDFDEDALDDQESADLGARGADADTDTGADAAGGADDEAGADDDAADAGDVGVDEGAEADGEAEGDEDDGEDDVEPEPKPAKKGKEPTIPKSRLDQSLRKQRAAEQRAQELADELAQLRAEREAANAPKPISPEEIQAKMVEANEALIAGDTAKAAQLQAEVLASMAPKPAAKSEPTAVVDPVEQLEQRLEFKQALQDTYARFPELDDNGDAFDQELSEEAVDFQRVYMERGYTLAEATKKAAEAVAKIHGLADRKATPVKVEATQKELKAKARTKLEKATKAAPPLGGKTDKSNDAVFDVRTASIEEFMALPQSVQDRLLGNTI
jgi:hypothetical protein